VRLCSEQTYLLVVGAGENGQVGDRTVMMHTPASICYLFQKKPTVAKTMNVHVTEYIFLKEV